MTTDSKNVSRLGPQQGGGLYRMIHASQRGTFMARSLNSHPALRTYQNHYPELGDRVYVDPSAVVIGQVSIGEDSSVWPCAVIRGDMHWIRIGARTSIQDGSVLHITHAGPFNPEGFPLSIGDDVTVG